MDINLFPLQSFRALYLQFNSLADDDVLIVARSAINYFSTDNNICRDELWMLVTAHMLALRQMIAEGLSPIGVITNATIDKISVSFAPPPISSDWSHWFKITLYGQQFLTLISRCNLAQYQDTQQGKLDNV